MNLWKCHLLIRLFHVYIITNLKGNAKILNENFKSNKISIDLYNELSENPKQQIDIIIHMKKGIQPVVEKLSTDHNVLSISNTPSNENNNNIVTELKKYADNTQNDIIKLLTKPNINDDELLSTNKTNSTYENNNKYKYKYKHTSYWITNSLSIKGATKDLILSIEKNDKVEGIYIDKKVLLDPIDDGDGNSDNSNDLSDDYNRDHKYGQGSQNNCEWSILSTGVDKVWQKNITGEGIIIGSIDTGVRGTHEALKDSFVGEYGWYDTFEHTSTPTDDVGHGTHTTGTMVGKFGIGVAPNAKWMACKACDKNGCPDSSLLKCAQFMACPTDSYGKKKDCSKVPDIINCSWGGRKGSDFYKRAIDGWLALGIIPIFASGNTGSKGCGTISSPADYENVISVGAIDEKNRIASFSSTGPTKSGLHKPDVCAPGVKIRSSYARSDADYKTLSGTSMASPHVAGIAALILSSHRSYKFQDVKNLIQMTADKGIDTLGEYCDTELYSVYPNNVYGYGKINAYKSIFSQPDTSSNMNVSDNKTNINKENFTGQSGSLRKYYKPFSNDGNTGNSSSKIVAATLKVVSAVANLVTSISDNALYLLPADNSERYNSTNGTSDDASSQDYINVTSFFSRKKAKLDGNNENNEGTAGKSSLSQYMIRCIVTMLPDIITDVLGMALQGDFDIMSVNKLKSNNRKKEVNIPLMNSLKNHTRSINLSP